MLPETASSLIESASTLYFTLFELYLFELYLPTTGFYESPRNPKSIRLVLMLSGFISGAFL